MWLAWVAFFLAFVSTTFADVKEVWWDLTYVNNANPDGLYERRVIGVNGTWPYVSTCLADIGNIHFEVAGHRPST
jgi:hypothetical protein